MKLVPFLNGVITAPHGVTDLIHAYKYNNIENLLRIYTGSFIFTGIAETVHLHQVIDIFFITSSIIHFSHDFNVVSNSRINKLLLSSILIASAPIIGVNNFSIYLLLFHTPRHYIKSWKFIKDKKKMLFLLILLFSFPGYYIFDNINNLNPNLLSITETIIISHIIYNEKYIDT